MKQDVSEEINETGFWDTAYRKNAPVLSGVLRRYVSDSNTARDLLHETFATAIDKHAGYTGKGSFEGWLHRIAVNTALMYLRSEKNKPGSTELLSTVIAADDFDENNADDARTAIEEADFSDEELLSAVDRLPEHHKTVFNMYVMDDFSHKQIAAELNISSGTSKSHLARARKKIQQYLYEDALNKKRTKVGKRASALILLFPAKTHFIDKLYRTRLSDYSLPLGGDTGFLSAVTSQNAAVTGSGISQAVTSTGMQVAANTAFWGSKLSYVVMCCGTAIATSTTCWLSMSENSPLNMDKEIVPITDISTHSSETFASDSSAFDATNHVDFVSTDSVAATDPLFSASKDSDRQTDSEASMSESISKPVPDSDVKLNPKPNSISNSSTTHGSDSPKTRKPVVVKKQIIQHKTVVVRDTIIIRE